MSNLPQTFEEWLRWTRVAVAVVLEQAADAVEDGECKEACASVIHAELCPVVNPGNVVRSFIPADFRTLLEAHDRAERHDELEMAHIESQRSPDLATLRGYMAKRLADLRVKDGEGAAK